MSEGAASMGHMAQPGFDAPLRSDRPLSWEDLQDIPDDRHWAYEIVEGTLFVSPAPGLRHQVCVTALWRLLADAVPLSLLALVSPFDFVPRPGYTLQPDVLVVDRATVEPQRTVVPPLLAVEVLSPSSRTTDTTLKRQVYEEFGVASYWIVDPDVPSLLTLELVDDRYVEVAHVAGAGAWTAERPFPVTVSPARLADPT